MNGERSPTNLPVSKNMADILKNSIESLWNTYGIKYFLTVCGDLEKNEVIKKEMQLTALSFTRFL